MCNGIYDKDKICPLREKCYRYTAKPDEYWQAYIEAPYDEKKECKHFYKR